VSLALKPNPKTKPKNQWTPALTFILNSSQSVAVRYGSFDTSSRVGSLHLGLGSPLGLGLVVSLSTVCAFSLPQHDQVPRGSSPEIKGSMIRVGSIFTAITGA